MLLDWIGRRRGRENLAAAARAIEGAVDALLERSETRTGDLGGRLGTRAFGEAPVARIRGS